MIDHRVSIIIPHRNQPAQLRKCLDRLMELGYGNQEIIVVDNGSEMIPDYFNNYPVKMLRSDSKPSPYIARNLGIERSGCDIIALLDVNAIVESGWLEYALDLLRDDTILGGIVARPNPARLNLFQRFDYLHSVIDPKDPGPIKALPATNLFFYKKVWEVVGPFQEVRSLGDMEWTVRARNLGYKLTVNSHVRFQYPFKSRKAFTAKCRRLGRGHAENDFHNFPLWYVVKNMLPPSPRFVHRMQSKNRREKMNLSLFQIIGLCYWVKINYGIGYISNPMTSKKSH